MFIDRRKALLAGILTGAFVVLAQPKTPNALAATDDANCNFREQLEAVKNAAEDPGLDSAQKIKAELGARKAMLKNIIACAAQDAAKIRAELEAVAVSDGEAQQIKKRLADDLNSAIQYYVAQKNKVDEVGLRGSQELAANIKEWRTINYNPLSQKAANFIAWNKNRELIQTAHNRLNQIRRAITVLKLLNDDEFQNLFGRADSYFREAAAINDRVLQSFNRLGNPEDTLVLIKSALDYLSQTYQEFFTISERINKLLPQ